MHHHGKGVYSGTFSGTLNPALQDANGQPKRDITTIVHILNDLLCAQFKAYSSSSRSSRHRESRGAQGTKEQGTFGELPPSAFATIPSSPSDPPDHHPGHLPDHLPDHPLTLVLQTGRTRRQHGRWWSGSWR